MTQRLTTSNIIRSVTDISWSSDFAEYLEDSLMEECYTWEVGIMDQFDIRLTT